MMKEVYVVEGGWCYEGAEVLGVFSTLKLAEACAGDTKERKYKYDYVDISKHTVDVVGSGEYYANTN